jgi:hypothetical protein
MCRGKLREKAGRLFDVILGPQQRERGESQISWRSGRIINAFKQLIYFSEIFPKKF